MKKLFICITLLLITSCGVDLSAEGETTSKVEGGTTHTVDGEVRQVITIDFEPINDFCEDAYETEEEIAACKRDIADFMLNTNNEKE